MKQIRFLSIAVLGLMGLLIVGNQKAEAGASSYGLSCTNKAYGPSIHNDGTTYLQAYIGIGTSSSGTLGENGTYVGTDCLYSGAGKTNSSAIVAGDVARIAVNSIVGAINNRIDAAMAQNSDTSAHMSYSADRSGLGISANKIFGGISLWATMTDSDFDNDQTFTAYATDSNFYDADAESVSFGIDKKVGNFLLGISQNEFEVDMTTSVNGGTYKAEGETVGVYAAFKTGIISVSAGMGSGDYDFDTTRRDLGTGAVSITGTGSADFEYTHLELSAHLSRGRFDFSPRLSYRDASLDHPAFTDVVANDSNTAGPNSNNSTGTDSTGKNVNNESVSAYNVNTDTVELGLRIAANLRFVMPFIDLAYQSEDTTKASYLSELTTDGVDDSAASERDGSMTFGGGVNFRLGRLLSGSITYTNVTDRSDYNETTTLGSIRLQF